MVFRPLSLLFVLFIAVPAFGGYGEGESDVESVLRLARAWELGAITESIEALDGIARRSFALGDWTTGLQALREESRLLGISNNTDQARRVLVRARDIARERGLAEDEALTECALLIAEAILSPSSATDETLRSLDRFEKLGPKVRVWVLATRGAVFAMRQDEAGSVAAYERALEISGSLDNARIEAELRIELGYAYLFGGRVERAPDEFERAMEISRNSGERRIETIAIIALGVYHTVIGDLRTGLDRLLEAEKRFPNGLDGEIHGALFNGIANVYERFNALDQSARYRKLALQEMSEAASRYGVLDTLYSQIRDDILAGRLERVDEALQKCIDDARQYGVIVTEKLCLVSRASVRIKQRRYRDAERDLDQAKLQIPGFPHLRGWSLKQLGDLSFASDDLDEAERRYGDALVYCRKMRLNVIENEVLFEMARVEERKGKIQSAIGLLRQSIASSDELARDIGNDRLQTAFVAGNFERYELLVKELVTLDGLEPGNGHFVEALRVSEGARARVMRETIELSRMRDSATDNPELVHREFLIRQEVQKKLGELSVLLERDAPRPEIEAVDSELARLKTERDEIGRKLKEQNPFYGALKQGVGIDVEEVRRTLFDDHTVAIEYFLGNASSAMWLIGKDGVRMHALPPGPAIAEKVREFRSRLFDREIRVGETIESFRSRQYESERAIAMIGTELSESLLAPFRDEIKGKRIILIPDGILHSLSFAALPSPAGGGDAPLIETNEVIYEHSLATLSLLADRSGPRVESSRPVLVVFDPVFGRDDERLRGIVAYDGRESNIALPRLKATVDEATAVREAVGGRRTFDISGFAASRSAFLDADLSQFGVIHLATHAKADNDRADLSGVVFSRYSPEGTEIDDILRLGDIYGLRLNSELVVLSACDTGAGEEVRGEGVESVANGFVAAGSKAVVSSMWKIDDDATRVLMTAFYHELGKGDVTAAEALRKAQIALRSDPQYRSPYYWASFTILGDPGAKPNLSGDSRYRFALLFLLPLFAGFFSYLLRLKKRSLHSKVINDREAA